MEDLRRMRIDYKAGSLNEAKLPPEPMELFRVWLSEAISAGLSEPNAMTVVTSSLEGKPSARVLLLKEVNEEGFVFFTNYLSRKGKDIEVNPQVALVFDWHDVERQLRVEGIVEKLSDAESDAYFDARPDDAKIGAWASPQSKTVKNREELEKLEEEIIEQFEDMPVHRPSHWGGYLVRPDMIEFWQGRPSRMHDRIVYHKTEEGWDMSRLAP